MVTAMYCEALCLRDPKTASHSANTAQLAVRFGRYLGLSGESLRELGRGALLHDIGKLGIPDDILHKPNRLTREEYRCMQRHVPIALLMLCQGPALSQEVMAIVGSHHEWFNGSGYPNHLGGNQIPLVARLFAIVDAVDAMRSDRSYRTGLGEAELLRRINHGSGSQFDPVLVAAFTTNAEEIMMGLY